MVNFISLNQMSLLAGLSSPEATPGRGAQGFTVREFWPFTATQIAWQNGKSKPIPKALGLATLPETMAQGYVKATDGAMILPFMPGRVLRVGAMPLDQATQAKLQAVGAYTLDLTAGRVLLGLRGAAWRWTLMKGGGLDFETLEVGDVAQTTLFKVLTLLWVVEPNEIRLLVSYTFARAFVEKLLDAGLDQGLESVMVPPSHFAMRTIATP